MMVMTDASCVNVSIKTVAQDLCVGCGVCAGVCPTGNLTMAWTATGQYQPCDGGRCLSACHRCLDVCPFQNHEENEDALAKTLFSNINGIQYTPETGYNLDSFVGNAQGGYRERGASGGMASWILTTLLAQGEVDRIVCVRPNADPKKLFRYAVLSTVDDVQQASKSAYYPVELSEVIQIMLREDARYAVIGLPCFLKALRLAMLVDRRLRERIVATVGLVCGHLKSAGFAQKLACLLSESCPAQTIVFREKIAERPSNDYGVSAVYVDGTHQSALMSAIMPDAWPANLFKLRSCDFCDDIFAEVADVTCMDAWLPAYTPDARGTSIVLVRSERMRQFIATGMAQGDVSLQPIPIAQVIASQAAVVAQKRTDLAYRLWLARKSGAWMPNKRVLPSRPSLLNRWLQLAREELRLLSHSSTDLQDYDATAYKIKRRISRLQELADNGCLRGIAVRIMKKLKGSTKLRI